MPASITQIYALQNAQAPFSHSWLKMTLSPIIGEILPDGSDEVPKVLVLIKQKEAPRNEQGYATFSLEGEGIRNEWWHICRWDRPTVHLQEILRLLQRRRVYAYAVRDPSKAMIEHTTKFCTNLGRTIHCSTEGDTSQLWCTEHQTSYASCRELHKAQLYWYNQLKKKTWEHPRVTAA